MKGQVAGWDDLGVTASARLTADESDAWMQVLALVEYLPGVIDQQLKRDADLGRFEYAVLLRLSRASGRCLTMLELSAVAFGSLSRLSHAITRLEQRAYVTRERNGANRYVTLTDDGDAAMRSAASGHVAQIHAQVLDHVPAGRARDLADLLRPIVDHLKATAPRG